MKYEPQTPLKCWDASSNTGELMDLYHQLRKSYEHIRNADSGVTEEQFVEKQGILLWGVQKSKVTFTLLSTGELKAYFAADNLDGPDDEDEAE